MAQKPENDQVKKVPGNTVLGIFLLPLGVIDLDFRLLFWRLYAVG
jgi:hypothetical protein